MYAHYIQCLKYCIYSVHVLAVISGLHGIDQTILFKQMIIVAILAEACYRTMVTVYRLHICLHNYYLTSTYLHGYRLDKYPRLFGHIFRYSRFAM